MIQMWLKREQFLGTYTFQAGTLLVSFSEASVTIYLQGWAMFNLERENEKRKGERETNRKEQRMEGEGEKEINL